MKAPPAFQFYPDVFEQGTANMTLAEVGGYMRLLNAQWAQGSIPGDDAKRLAVIMRCTPAAALRVWTVVRDKFVRWPDGGWRNARMEHERTKQARFREAQAGRGKLGGRPKAGEKPDESLGFSPGFIRHNPDESGRLVNPEQSPPSPSPSLERTPPVPPSGEGGLPRRGRRRGPLPDVWHQQERMAEMRRLMADGLSYADAQRKAFG